MKEGTREVGEYRPSCLTMLVVLVLLVVLSRYHPECNPAVAPVAPVAPQVE